ncbi:MAG TPA: menaquinone biosynthesis decarboxylase, partial [Chitinophagaceae bacterium]|nr:menaquinone biosynthesis decarboxylase [Chitinophagaceae bacterium]
KMTLIPEIVDMDMPVEGVFHNLVIAKIKKDYAGQGQKVMNAMWGAGQMMFNKILVLVDGEMKIQNYEELAKYVFKNINPATDIYFSQGPMDVLDHSCSKLGFGGKMCIDGTFKLDEEVDESYELRIKNEELKIDLLLKESFGEIEIVNSSLLAKQISCLIISVKKNRKGHIKELHEQICLLKEIVGVKMILYVEHTVDANDLPTALWRFCNNLDPKRDSHINKRPTTNLKLQISNYTACVGFDGTRKTKEFDDFNRDWPNIIVADDETIKSVDAKWNELNIGKLIPSPSLKFKDQLYGEEAVVN